MNTEIAFTQILQDVVGVKNLDRNARFIDIGGNSLNLVHVLKHIEDQFGVSPPPRIFFDKSRSTIAAISAVIDSQVQESQSTVVNNSRGSAQEASRPAAVSAANHA